MEFADIHMRPRMTLRTLIGLTMILYVLAGWTGHSTRQFLMRTFRRIIHLRTARFWYEIKVQHGR